MADIMICVTWFAAIIWAIAYEVGYHKGYRKGTGEHITSTKWLVQNKDLMKCTLEQYSFAANEMCKVNDCRYCPLEPDKCDKKCLLVQLNERSWLIR